MKGWFEIIKGMIPFPAAQNTDATRERYRRALIQILAGLGGTVIALVAQKQIQPLISNIFTTPHVIGLPGCIIIGLFASGGFGFWKQSLSIVEEIRKAKKLQNLRKK